VLHSCVTQNLPARLQQTVQKADRSIAAISAAKYVFVDQCGQLITCDAVELLKQRNPKLIKSPRASVSSPAGSARYAQDQDQKKIRKSAKHEKLRRPPEIKAHLEGAVSATSVGIEDGTQSTTVVGGASGLQVTAVGGASAHQEAGLQVTAHAGGTKTTAGGNGSRCAKIESA
jgi:hypothetical protein